MTSFSNVDQLLKKLARPAQKVGKKRVKFPWHRRQSAKRGQKLTEAERQELKEKRETKCVNLDDALKAAREAMFKHAEDMSEQFGRVHKPEYYYSLIMQQSRLKVKEQKFSKWNVFVSRETRRHNDELGASGGQRVSSAFIKELSVRWKEMSQEQKDAATADGIEELEERRQNRKEGTQNVLIKSFHDARATLGSIQRELDFLAGRTGLRIVTMAVRPTSDAFNALFVFYSDERVAYYFETLTKMPMQELAVALKGFCLSGIKAITQNHRMQLGDWKTRVKDFILEKLSEASTRGPITKMFYVNFDQHITVKFGIILENWPLTKFAAPGSFSSIPLLSLLYNAFDNGATRFRSLTDDEWLQWLQAYKAGLEPPAVTSSLTLVDVEEDPAEKSALESASESTPDSSTPESTPESAPVSVPSASASASVDPIAPTSNVVPALAVSSSPSTLGPDITMAETPGVGTSGARGQKRSLEQAGDMALFVNNFASADGTGIVQVTKKPRKQRSDAGKKRGPRKKNATAAAQASQAATPAPMTPAPATPAPTSPVPTMPAPGTPALAMPASTTLTTSESVSAPTAVAGATA